MSMDYFTTADGRTWKHLDRFFMTQEVEPLVVANVLAAREKWAPVWEATDFNPEQETISGELLIIIDDYGHTSWDLYGTGEAQEAFESYPCVDDTFSSEFEYDLFWRWVWGNGAFKYFGNWDLSRLEAKLGGEDQVLNIIERTVSDWLDSDGSYLMLVKATDHDAETLMPIIDDDIWIDGRASDALEEAVFTALVEAVRMTNHALIAERRHGYKRKQAVLPGINPDTLPENNVPTWAHRR